jgi:hypothetical protein
MLGMEVFNHIPFGSRDWEKRILVPVGYGAHWTLRRKIMRIKACSSTPNATSFEDRVVKNRTKKKKKSFKSTRHGSCFKQPSTHVSPVPWMFQRPNKSINLKHFSPRKRDRYAVQRVLQKRLHWSFLVWYKAWTFGRWLCLSGNLYNVAWLFWAISLGGH